MQGFCLTQSQTAILGGVERNPGDYVVIHPACSASCAGSP